MIFSVLSNRKLLSRWIDVSGNRPSFPKRRCQIGEGIVLKRGCVSRVSFEKCPIRDGFQSPFWRFINVTIITSIGCAKSHR